MRALHRATLTCVLALAGCGPTAIAPLPAQGPAGQRELAMMNCPSAVVGASTVFGYAREGVVLDITAADPRGTDEVRARAAKHAAMGEPDASAGLHTGKHGGPGDRGHCPIIHTGTAVTVEEIFAGARITIRALDPAMVPELQRETRARLAWFAPPTEAAAPTRPTP